MAKATRGSGQGRVRKEHNYVMVRCADNGCLRAMGLLFPPHERPAETPTWSCGSPPLLAKTRVGQQKQAR